MPTLGVVPWLNVPLPEEDGVALQGADGGEGASRSSHSPASRIWTSSLRSARTRASSAAPAEVESGSRIVIPGTKSTLADLDWLRTTGLAGAITPRRRRRAGPRICGGLQILGRSVRDPLRSRAAARHRASACSTS